MVQTQVNAAKIAVENLRRQGFCYYNPMVSERVFRRGDAGWRRVQLFKDYVFVDIKNQWRAILGTRGVSRLLMERPEVPARVSDEVISLLQSQEDPLTGLIDLSRESFYRGQTVYVGSGPFADKLAIYDGQSGKDRVFVLLRLLGKTNRLEVYEGSLTAA